MPPVIIGCLLIVTYEYILRNYGLAEVILDRYAVRSNFYLMNKEGISSSVGLTALYLIYVQMGRHLLPLIERGAALARYIF